MEMKDTALLGRLWELFALEAEEHLQAITAELLELEKQPETARYTELVETLYREVHTLKGAARAVNLSEIETICQVTESVCAALKRQEFGVWPELFDTLHRAMDLVQQLSAGSEEVESGQVAEMVSAVKELEAQGRARVAEEPDVVAEPEPVVEALAAAEVSAPEPTPPASPLLLNSMEIGEEHPGTASSGEPDSLLGRLRELFALEAEEHLQAITAELLELEKQPETARYTELVETLYREVHTLKGAARAVNLSEIETICQVTESVCAALKRQEFGVWPELFDTLHRAMDLVQQLSAGSEEVESGQVAEMVSAVKELEAQGRARVAEEPDVVAEPEPVVEALAAAEVSAPEPTPPASPLQTESSSELSLSREEEPQEVSATTVEEAPVPAPSKKRRRVLTTQRKAASRRARAPKKKPVATEAAAVETGEETAAITEKQAILPTEPVRMEAPELAASENLPLAMSLAGPQSETQDQACVPPNIEAQATFEPAPQKSWQAGEAPSSATEDTLGTDPTQQELLARLRSIFAVEAGEYLQTITDTALALERECDEEQEKALLETLFRCMHSLKGAACAVNFREVEGICQVLEDVCASLKRREFGVWPEFFDVFHRVMDAVRQLSLPLEEQTEVDVAEIVEEVNRLAAEGRSRTGETQPSRLPLASFPEPPPTDLEQNPQLDFQEESFEQEDIPVEALVEDEEETELSPEQVQELFDAPGSTPTGAKPVMPVVADQSEKEGVPQAKGQGVKKKAADMVRVETTKLDSLFLQAEEMLAVKLKTSDRASELRELTAMLETWKREWASVHTTIRKAQRLLEKEENLDSQDPLYEQAVKLVEFLDWTHSHFKIVDKMLKQVAKVVVQDQQSVGAMVDILLEEAKKVLMLPFSSALEVLPKMVRDVSRARGKEVDFSFQGGDVEVDKRILEEIKDPLIHLLRNCIDHGIESPAERERMQKPRRGSISIAIAPGDGNSVEIIVQDDGGGIDAAKVRKAAVKSGSLSLAAADQLPDQEAILLIFQSEVSTSETVNDLSGRGLGMAIVREKVEKLGGQIAVSTQLQKGTTFRIRLPLTLATFRGVLIQAAGQTFVFPTVNVERVLRVNREAILSEGAAETIVLGGETLPFLRLNRVLGLATKANDEERGRFQLALLVGQGEQGVVFAIDAVMSEQEVLFKGLGPQLIRVRNIAGATVLGSGQVAPVVNVKDLIAAVHEVAAPVALVSEEAPKEEVRKKSILVAEDSITSRMLLKEILESAGYVVSTAINGEDAFSSLQKGTFDLVVSDVEMPRMNGFDLASKIRGDERYGQLPVVLVTGLESETDRERGVRMGASAYVVKGSFDQSNLLETIRQLI